MAEKKEKKNSAWLVRIGDRQTVWSLVRECGIVMLFRAVVPASFFFK